jgi:hypothetical protein
MADANDVHEYPSELKEKGGGPVPLFLKLTYLGFTLFGIIYWVLYRAGDGARLVEQFNKLTGNGP